MKWFKRHLWREVGPRHWHAAEKFPSGYTRWVWSTHERDMLAVDATRVVPIRYFGVPNQEEFSLDKPAALESRTGRDLPPTLPKEDEEPIERCDVSTVLRQL